MIFYMNNAYIKGDQLEKERSAESKSIFLSDMFDTNIFGSNRKKIEEKLGSEHLYRTCRFVDYSGIYFIDAHNSIGTRCLTGSACSQDRVGSRGGLFRKTSRSSPSTT